jgi:hypothetical protein
MRLFVTITILMISLVVAAGQRLATQGYAGRNAMDKPVGTIHKDIPSIDKKTPSIVKTATFALG